MNGVATLRIFLLATLLMAALAACGPSEAPKTESQQSPAADKTNAEKTNEQIQILTQKDRSNESFLQQIRARMHVTDGFLLIENSFETDTMLLPVTSGWSLTCGMSGLAVSFGSAVSGSADGNSSSVDNEAKLELSMIPLSRERCRELAPVIGKEVQRLLGQR